MLNVVCVRVGDKYGPEYVERLRSMVARHLDRPHRWWVISEHEQTRPEGAPLPPVRVLPGGLSSYWAKMKVFDLGSWFGEPILYFDLDTVIVGDLGPLADAAERTPGLGICANFARARSPAYPCRFGSCVMTLAPGWGGYVWERFEAHRRDLPRLWTGCWPHGDQEAIEHFVEPADVTLLQDVLPPGYLCSYRDLTVDGPPPGAAVINFGGSHKPHNSPHEWVRGAWR